MKRSTLFSFILFAAILICFFSSTVLAGGGNNPTGDTHPWDMDGNGADTSDVNTHVISRAQVMEPLSWMTFSLSYSFNMWMLFDDAVFIEKKQVEVIETKLNARGSNFSEKLMK